MQILDEETEEINTNANDGYHGLKGARTFIIIFIILWKFCSITIALIYTVPIFFIYYSIIFNFSYHWLYMRKEHRDLERSWPWRYILK